MWAKILAAVAMPLAVAALVGGLLVLTHHTTVPPLAVPATRSAGTIVADPSPSVNLGPCLGKIPSHFAGIAAKGNLERQAASFGAATGSKPQVMEFYNPFRKPFARGEAELAVAAGQIPLIQLNPWRVSERQIADGSWDRHLKSYALDVKKFGCTVILSFGHEMNGWWYPWGMPRTSPAVFIAAWRHIHDVFAAQGVRNVIWSWDPSHQYGQLAAGKVATAASAWYPGNTYVDWIGLDGYLGVDASGQLQNFKQIFAFQLHDIRKVAPGKRVYLAETGVAPGPDAAMQVTELFAGISAYRLAGIIWFDAISKRHDYRLGIKKSEDAAYRRGLSGFLG